MKVVGIVGSPRRGANCETLVQKVLEGAATAGAQTECFILNEMNIRGCQACNYCKEHGRCRQEDHMQRLLEALLNSDAMVLGTPVYIDYVTAQTKLFMDRLFVFLRPGVGSTFPKGKKMVMVYSQGMGENRQMIEDVARHVARALNMELKGVVGGNNMNDPNAVKNRPALLEEAFRLGKELVG